MSSTKLRKKRTLLHPQSKIKELDVSSVNTIVFPIGMLPLFFNPIVKLSNLLHKPGPIDPQEFNKIIGEIILMVTNKKIVETNDTKTNQNLQRLIDHFEQEQAEHKKQQELHDHDPAKRNIPVVLNASFMCFTLAMALAENPTPESINQTRGILSGILDKLSVPQIKGVMQNLSAQLPNLAPKQQTGIFLTQSLIANKNPVIKSANITSLETAIANHYRTQLRVNPSNEFASFLAYASASAPTPLDDFLKFIPKPAFGNLGKTQTFFPPTPPARLTFSEISEINQLASINWQQKFGTIANLKW